MAGFYRHKLGRLCGVQPPSQGVRLDVVDEEPLAVELDDRQPLAIALLERRVAADLDLAEVEAELVPQLLELLLRPLAEVAAGGAEEDDLRYG